MQLRIIYKEQLTVFIFLFLGATLAIRTKRQIIFEDDGDNRVFNSDCRTPDRIPGQCVPLSSCSRLSQTVNRRRLRRYFCGFEGNEPKVCCPESMRNFISDRNTPRPTIRTTTPRSTTTRATPRTTTRVTATRRTTRTTTRRPTVRTTIRFDEEPRNGGSNTVGVTTRPQTGGLTKPSFLPRECGKQKFALRRVVGGEPALKGAWPWMAVVFVRRSNGALINDCGGALVTNRHVVTAAHCVVTGRRSTVLDPSRIVVRLGAHDLALPNEPEAIDVEVEAVQPHEQFESRTYKNDIAVLRLRRPVTFNKDIQPICLPYDSLRNEDLTSKAAYVTGYGTTAFNGESSDVLMVARFEFQSQEVCRRAYEAEVPITNVYLCAGTMDGSKDSCQGDSGGPLQAVGKNGSFYLVGVVSFGKQCGQPNYPGVYARVTEFLDWLADKLSN